MPSLPFILVVEATDTAPPLLQMAKQRFDAAIWHSVPAMAEAANCIKRSKYYSLVLIDYSVLVADQSIETVESFVRSSQLLYTPVLLFDSVYNTSRANWAYDAGFSAYHSRPSTASEWNKLVKTMCLYWFTVNQVPARR